MLDPIRVMLVGVCLGLHVHRTVVLTTSYEVSTEFGIDFIIPPYGVDFISYRILLYSFIFLIHTQLKHQCLVLQDQCQLISSSV